VAPNFELLNNVLIQYGPWQNEPLKVGVEWLDTALKEKIESVDWNQAADDVKRFLRPVEQKSLDVWSARFFTEKLAKLYGSVM
jgi:hypothetical protein